MADAKYRDKEQDFQRRAIVGDRHFVAISDNSWAQPGQIDTGKLDQYGRRIFQKRTLTTGQLRAWAKKIGQAVHINDQYPLVHPAKYTPKLKGA